VNLSGVGWEIIKAAAHAIGALTAPNEVSIAFTESYVVVC